MQTVEERLQACMFMVEANSFEKLTLWQEYHEKIPWDDDSSGFSQQVGEIGGMPVMITVFFTDIYDQKVAFWKSESMVTHFGMCEDWLYEAIGKPKWDGTRSAKSDAMNFHHCVTACRQAAGVE